MINFYFGNIEIPFPLISAFSYSKRARAIQHRNGFVSTRGFEASEVSIRIALNRANCNVLGVSFNDLLNTFRTLNISRSSEKAALFLGAVPIMGTVKFAITSTNISETSDCCLADAAEIELIFSPVDVTPKQEENFDFVSSSEFPNISILENSLEDFGVPVKVEAFQQTESETQIELAIGADSDVLDLQSWIEPLLEFIKIPISGVLTSIQTVTSCECSDGAIRLNLSFFSAAARRVFSHTYEDTTTRAILADVAARGEFLIGAVPDIPIKYYAIHGLNAVQALSQIAENIGCLVNFNGNVINIVKVPHRAEIVEAKTLLEASSENIEATPKITGVVLKCGWNDYKFGDMSNSITVDLPFNPLDEAAISENLLNYLNYKLNSIDVELPIDSQIAQHSPVKIVKGSNEILGLVDSFTTDYCTGQMKLHVCLL